jgi:choline dehydrogenase-like flavoprotein
VRWSGWPLRADDLVPFYEKAAELFGLHTKEFGLPYWSKIAPVPGLLLPDERFENQVFQYSPETNFGLAYREALLAAPRVTTLLCGNAVELEPGRGDRTATVRSIRAMSLRGNTFQVLARVVVLATGGIENPRLLLTSTGGHPTGMGNEHDWVGRCFMDHPHVPLGHLVPSNGRFSRDFYRKHRYGSHRIRGVLVPSAALQRERSLVGCSIAVERRAHKFGTAFLEWPPAVVFPLVQTRRRIKEHVSARLAWVAGAAAEVSYMFPRRLASAIRATRALRQASAKNGSGLWAKGEVYPLYVRSEQCPNPSSRVYLSDRRDSLESLQACLEWRVAQEDTESIWRCLGALKASVESAGLGRVILPEGEERERWKDRIIGAPHHMGTTRMSSDARLGVVDEHCRVHSVQNLYIAGSSVFPTSGYANPTFTIVALALRLARHIAKEYA